MLQTISSRAIQKQIAMTYRFYVNQIRTEKCTLTQAQELLDNHKQHNLGLVQIAGLAKAIAVFQYEEC